MKSQLIPFLAVSLIFSVAVTESGSARSLPKAKPTPVPEKSKAYAEIKSVSGDTITVEHSKATTTYKMSRETAVTIDDQRARGTDLKPGMHVEVTTSSINPNLLLSVAAHSASKS